MREWIVVRAEATVRHNPPPGWIVIECPDCGGSIIVHKKRWLRTSAGFTGRSCSYCFKTFRVPGLPDKARSK